MREFGAAITVYFMMTYSGKAIYTSTVNYGECSINIGYQHHEI